MHRRRKLRSKALRPVERLKRKLGISRLRFLIGSSCEEDGMCLAWFSWLTEVIAVGVLSNDVPILVCGSCVNKTIQVQGMQ